MMGLPYQTQAAIPCSAFCHTLVIPSPRFWVLAPTKRTGAIAAAKSVAPAYSSPKLDFFGSFRKSVPAASKSLSVFRSELFPPSSASLLGKMQVETDVAGKLD